MAANGVPNTSHAGDAGKQPPEQKRQSDRDQSNSCGGEGGRGPSEPSCRASHLRQSVRALLLAAAGAEVKGNEEKRGAHGEQEQPPSGQIGRSPDHMVCAHGGGHENEGEAERARGACEQRPAAVARIDPQRCDPARRGDRHEKERDSHRLVSSRKQRCRAKEREKRFGEKAKPQRPPGHSMPVATARTPSAMR